MASPLIPNQAPIPLSLSSNTGAIMPSDIGPMFSRGFKNICPVIRIEELCVKLGCKVRVLKARWVVLPHETNLFRAMVELPPAPKPLAEPPEARDREDTPVDENPDLRVVVPLGQGSGVQAGPVGGVARRASRGAGEEEGLQVHHISADSQLPFKHLFLHQVLHSANLHLVDIVHKTGPVRGHASAVHGLRLAGRVSAGGFLVSGGHAVAAVADAEASESRCDAGSSEGPPAALTRHWPVVPMDLLIVNTRMCLFMIPFCLAVYGQNGHLWSFTCTTKPSPAGRVREANSSDSPQRLGIR
ncbi:hypothetical protein EYF80_001582 [Liparis tanakae]|uniref:Uncharacterized protein n=1 Tax=Liparis tanakae TaxID=230148 RepID=A0A4Z2JDA9_9TELE|nr:hypothetical protein EYF80_001582 [Liparis tanakae]